MVHLDKYCSSQGQIDQQPYYRRWRRVHGLQIPLHQFQIVGWLLLAFFIATTFTILVPALGPSLRSPVLILLICLFSLHCISHFVALAIDPADYELRAREQAGIQSKGPDFDRSRHTHVIENGLCHICNIRASGPRTKHCRLCNKCVERFDHHCKWLNQCVGARNYVAFIVCIVSAVLASLAVFSVCVSELFIYFGNSVLVESLLQKKGLTDADYRVAHLPIARHYFLAVLIAQTILSLVAAICLLHLCLFHVYISMLGVTTYEYIRNEQKNCSAQTSSTPSSFTTTPTNATASSPMAASTLQSTSSLPAVAASNHLYPSSSSLRVADNFPNSTSEPNLVLKSSADCGNSNLAGENGHIPAMAFWRRWCGCEKSSFAVSTASSLGAIRTSRDLDSRTVTTPIDAGNGDLLLESLKYGGRGYEKRHSGMGNAPADCRYCRKGKLFGGHGATMTNGGVTPKSKNRRRSHRLGSKGGVLRLCCSTSHGWVRGSKAVDVHSFGRHSGGVIVGGESVLNGCRHNQIKPSAMSNRSCEGANGVVTVHHGGRIFIAPRRSNSLNSLPVLPPPARRQIQSVSLKELNEMLAYAQRPQTSNGIAVGGSMRRPLNSMRRQLRRKSNPQLKQTKTPNLSPIHESGLSNPSTPHLKDRLNRPKELSPLALNSHLQ